MGEIMVGVTHMNVKIGENNETLHFFYSFVNTCNFHISPKS
jgi:hypothetical protein